jgi:CMP/dCMP kinase
VITEGRDQGTIVFPDATRKFFLTATDEVRARRRHAEFLASGEAISVESVLEDLRERDASDATRTIAPMRPAADATIIDTTGIDLDQLVTLLEAEILQTETSPSGRASN